LTALLVLEPNPMPPTLHRTADHTRWFLIPSDEDPPRGSLTLQPLTGDAVNVHPAWAEAFEVSEDEGRAWVKGELSETLGEIKTSIDDGLAQFRAKIDAMKHSPVSEASPYTPDAVPALFAMLKSLPSVLGNSLSGDDTRVAAAKTATADTEQRLREAGIDIGKALSSFPDRLDGLRKEIARPKVPPT
jgi:hypothetical protein